MRKLEYNTAQSISAFGELFDPTLFLQVHDLLLDVGRISPQIDLVEDALFEKVFDQNKVFGLRRELVREIRPALNDAEGVEAGIADHSRDSDAVLVKDQDPLFFSIHDPSHQVDSSK